MKPLVFAALSLALCAGTASASTTVSPVKVIADPFETASLSLPCSNPRASDADVRRVLNVLDSRDTVFLRQGLHRAVGEACGQNVAAIVVSRRGLAVTWSPATEVDAAVAIALR